MALFSQHHQGTHHILCCRCRIAARGGRETRTLHLQVFPVHVIKTDCCRADKTNPGTLQQFTADPCHRTHQQDIGIAYLFRTHTPAGKQGHITQRGKCLLYTWNIFIGDDFHLAAKLAAQELMIFLSSSLTCFGLAFP